MLFILDGIFLKPTIYIWCLIQYINITSDFQLLVVSNLAITKQLQQEQYLVSNDRLLPIYSKAEVSLKKGWLSIQKWIKLSQRNKITIP